MKWPKLRKRNVQEITPNVDDVLLSAILSQDSISCEQALNIPAVARVRGRTSHVALKFGKIWKLISRAMCEAREIEFLKYLC